MIEDLDLAAATFLRRVPSGDILVSGPPPSLADRTFVQVDHPGRAAAGEQYVRRSIGPGGYPSGVFAGCWSSGMSPAALEAAISTVQPGGVLAVHSPEPPRADRRGRFLDAVPAGEAWVTLTRIGEAGPEAGDCVFCAPLRFRLNQLANVPGAAAILAGDRDFYVMPDLAPVADGHLLLVTMTHQLNSGALPQPLWPIADRWLEWIADLHRRAYGTESSLILEHGPGMAAAAGNCVDHTHWHIIPGTWDITHSTAQKTVPFSWPAVRDLNTAHIPYLRIGQRLHPGTSVAGQYLRQAMLARNSRTCEVWRWQELFALESTRNRFLRTLNTLLPIADALPAYR